MFCTLMPIRNAYTELTSEPFTIDLSLVKRTLKNYLYPSLRCTHLNTFSPE